MRHKLFINDEWVEPVKGEYFATIDPATEEPIAEVARATAADIDKAVKAADAAMNGPWSRLSPIERGALMFKLADAIAEQRDELARLETLDVGKPLRDSLSDVDGVVNTLRYNAGAADKMQGETIRGLQRTLCRGIFPWAWPCAPWRRRWRPAAPSC